MIFWYSTKNDTCKIKYQRNVCRVCRKKYCKAKEWRLDALCNCDKVATTNESCDNQKKRLVAKFFFNDIVTDIRMIAQKKPRLTP